MKRGEQEAWRERRMKRTLKVEMFNGARLAAAMESAHGRTTGDFFFSNREREREGEIENGKVDLRETVDWARH